MRLAVHHNLPSGGAKRSLYEWMRRLRARHEVDLFRLASTDESYLDVRPLASRVLEFDGGLARRGGSGLLRKALLFRRLDEVSRRMAAAVDAGGYDAAFVHHCAFVQSPMLLRHLRTPSVYMCQEPFRRGYESFHAAAAAGLSARLKAFVQSRAVDRVLAALDRENALRATILLANSHFSRETILRVYGRAARTNHLGVDAERFRPDGGAKEGFVLSVGRLVPHKGHEFVVETLARLPAAARPPLVVCCDQGGEEERRRLSALAQARGVRLSLRQIPGPEMPALYNRAALTVYAPYLEPLGLVPLESMACGTPVVGVHEGGVRETVRHGETGLLVERDPEDAAAAVAALLGDPARARAFGERGRRWVEEFWTWEASVARVEESLAKAAGRGPGGREA